MTDELSFRFSRNGSDETHYSAEVRQFLVERYAPALSSAGVSLDSLPDDYDLLERGMIDSIGILEMIGAVEAEFEIELDLEPLDAESLTKIGPFCRHVEGSAHAQVKESAYQRDDKPGSARPIVRLA